MIYNIVYDGVKTYKILTLYSRAFASFQHYLKVPFLSLLPTLYKFSFVE